MALRLMRQMHRLVACLGGGLLCVLVSACASQEPKQPPAAVRPADPSSYSTRQQGNDPDRLAQLWERRTTSGLSSDYPIGPGDVIEVSAPAIDELRDRTERVSGDKKLSMPFVGTIDVSGMTESGLKTEMVNRLGKYMFNPQVDVFVKEYRSRQVAVDGAVAKPGLYDLKSGSDTILDMISQAGGVTPDSAPRVLLLPGEEGPRIDGAGASANSQDGATAMSAAAASNDVATLLKSANPIVIETRNLARGGTQTYLALPVRPGDVIIIPAAGEVMVQGWVYKPGNYRITPGMTVLGAMGAAGGPMFAAKKSSVTIARTGRSGEKVLLTANLNKITSGDEPDIAVQEGDVIDVPYAAAKLLPYSLYSLIGHLGFGMPIIY